MSKLMSKLILGFVVAFAGLMAAIWFGGWVCFIGGIVTIIEAVKADPVSAWGILWGIIRWGLSWPAFWLTIMFGCGSGFSIIKGHSHIK